MGWAWTVPAHSRPLRNTQDRAKALQEGWMTGWRERLGTQRGERQGQSHPGLRSQAKPDSGFHSRSPPGLGESRGSRNVPGPSGFGHRSLSLVLGKQKNGTGCRWEPYQCLRGSLSSTGAKGHAHGHAKNLWQGLRSPHPLHPCELHAPVGAGCAVLPRPLPIAWCLARQGCPCLRLKGREGVFVQTNEGRVKFPLPREVSKLIAGMLALLPAGRHRLR